MAFIDDRYLLSGVTAEKLYRDLRELPIIDPHNHADVAEIAANRNYPDPWALFAATDHYVWEVLRKRGVPESHITGNAEPIEKWLKMASVFPEIAGNPVYEWIHLDLKRYLGIDTVLGPDTGKKIWRDASNVLARPESRPMQLLEKIGVELMCSTDDPVDLLNEHDIVNSTVGSTLIRPTWRPDKAMNISKPGWTEYISKLESRFQRKLNSISDLIDVMRISHDYFAEHGCRASDHGVTVPYSGTASRENADHAFRTMREKGSITDTDAALFASYLLGEMAEINAAKNWVFQLHIGAVRDVRDKLFDQIGPDSGGDVSNHFMDILSPLQKFMNRFDGRLKIVLYCLDAGHQATLATMARAFGEKVALGSAWWLCDTPIGMRRQLEYIGSVDLFANFAGMVSDSRKLLSYGSRHEMFRRILSDLIGKMTDCGQMPCDVAAKLTKRMCYDGVKEFWNL